MRPSFGSLLLLFIIMGCSKSKQQNTYSMEGTFSFKGSVITVYQGIPPYTNNFIYDSVLMRTTGPDDMEMFWVVNGVYDPHRIVMVPSGAYFAVGGTAAQFTFDLANDTCTSVNNIDPLQTIFFARDPNYFSRYDSTTGTYYLAYIMTQASSPIYYHFFDTLKYIGPIP